MAKRNIKLTIQYDGYDYHGWQVQPGYKTIQETLNKAISDLVGHKVHATAASRTDAGVSALGQVAIIQIDSPIPTENLTKAITDRLPEDILVAKAEELPGGFDIIGAVKSKLYRYTIFTGPTRPVLASRPPLLIQPLSSGDDGARRGSVREPRTRQRSRLFSRAVPLSNGSGHSSHSKLSTRNRPKIGAKTVFL